MYEIKSTAHRAKALFEFWVKDHEFVRAIYRNFHTVSKDVYRSSQPSFRFIKNLQKSHNLKTIINLRGENTTGPYLLEREACNALGVKLISASFSSRRAPTPERLKAYFKALDDASYPILLHCKSGADRAGLASALYLFYKEGVPLDITRQLRPAYGHFKSSETGILDHFIDTWNAFHSANPDIPFLTWVDTVYDAHKMNKDYLSSPSRMGNFIVNTLLRRE